MKIFKLRIFCIVLFGFSLTTDIISEYESNIELGRNNDPKLVEDISKIKLWFNKRKWEFLTFPGLRNWTNLIYPKSTISHFTTDDKIVAFTIDDGFCGLDNPGGCMIEEVRLLFKKYNSKATFFTTGSHCKNADYNEVVKLLEDGHELANHGMYDTPYNKFSSEDFKKDLELTDSLLKQYTNNIPNFYRAPRARYSKEMDAIIDEKGLIHIVCDAFAIDTSTPDPRWISNYIIKKTKPGSILLIHMPEKGIREWNLEAMELTLQKLKENGYKVETLSYMFENYNSPNLD